MGFSNPRTAQAVGILRLVRFHRVPSSLPTTLSNVEHSWPITCLVISGNPEPEAIVEIRISVMLATGFVDELDAYDRQPVIVTGTRWTQHDDATNRRRLIDVMFDPTIAAGSSRYQQVE